MHITRRKTRQIQVGKLKIGGDAPVSVQSMCSTDTRDAAATIEQIRQLEAAGCEVIRVAVPDDEAAAVLPKIKAAMTVPLITTANTTPSQAQICDGARVEIRARAGRSAARSGWGRRWARRGSR